jgi:hypothetical protein
MQVFGRGENSFVKQKESAEVASLGIFWLDLQRGLG